jgi:TetR/AcrR family acrAB operon transcriptional repressor
LERLTLPQQRAIETRGLILDAARTVFAAEGFATATVDDVATAASVSKGAVYHHFRSKEDLFFALIGRRDAPALSELATAAQSAATFEEILDLIVAGWLNHYTSDRLFTALSLEFRLQATRDERFQRRLGELLTGLRSMLAGLIRAAQEDDVVSRDLDAQALAPILFGLLDGISLQWCVDPTSLRPQDMTRDLAAAMNRIIGAQSTSATELSAIKAFLVECAKEVEDGAIEAGNVRNESNDYETRGAAS